LYNISQFKIHDFSAILQVNGDICIFDFISQTSFACSYVGIIFTSRFVSILVFIQIGFTQIKNSIENIKIAKTKFIKIPASITIDCCQIGFVIRLSLDLLSSSFLRTSSFSSLFSFSFSLVNSSFHSLIFFSIFSLFSDFLFSSNSSNLFIISHFNLTNHQSGSQFRLYRVQALSVHNFFALGGIHNQNSSTFTQKIRAVLKCPYS
jgi:hypothetical protein